MKNSVKSISLMLLIFPVMSFGHSLTFKEIYQVIDDCVKEQVDLCGDLICEGELEFEPVIQNTGDAIKLCFEDKEINTIIKNKGR